MKPQIEYNMSRFRPEIILWLKESFESIHPPESAFCATGFIKYLYKLDHGKQPDNIALHNLIVEHFAVYRAQKSIDGFRVRGYVGMRVKDSILSRLQKGS